MMTVWISTNLQIKGWSLSLPSFVMSHHNCTRSSYSFETLTVPKCCQASLTKLAFFLMLRILMALEWDAIRLDVYSAFKLAWKNSCWCKIAEIVKLLQMMQSTNSYYNNKAWKCYFHNTWAQCFHSFHFKSPLHCSDFCSFPDSSYLIHSMKDLMIT